MMYRRFLPRISASGTGTLYQPQLVIKFYVWLMPKLRDASQGPHPATGSSPIFGDKSPIDSPRRDWPGQKKSERMFVEASQGMHS